MKKSIRLASACLLIVSVAAHAADDTYVFESISSVEHYSDNAAAITNGTVLTGVLSNGSPTSLAVPALQTASARCADYYEVMLKVQGVYVLSLTIRTTTIADPFGTVTNIELRKCSLTRNP